MKLLTALRRLFRRKPKHHSFMLGDVKLTIRECPTEPIELAPRSYAEIAATCNALLPPDLEFDGVIDASRGLFRVRPRPGRPMGPSERRYT